MHFCTLSLILRKKKDTFFEIFRFFEKPSFFFRFQNFYFPMVHFWRVRNSSVFNLESKILLSFKELKLFLTLILFLSIKLASVHFFRNMKPVCNFARNFRCFHFSSFLFTLSNVLSRKVIPNLKSNKANLRNVWDSGKKKIPFGSKTEKCIFVCFCFFKRNYLFD